MAKILKDDGGQAFPGIFVGSSVAKEHYTLSVHGMTLHQYYAGQGLNGMTAAHKADNEFWSGKDSKDKAANHCLDFADAMIKAYKKRGIK